MGLLDHLQYTYIVYGITENLADFMRFQLEKIKAAEEKRTTNHHSGDGFKIS